MSEITVVEALEAPRVDEMIGETMIEMENEELWRKISWIVGVTYAILFGGSLFFQVVNNFLNESTKGFSTDYALVGFVGFFFLLFN